MRKYGVLFTLGILVIFVSTSPAAGETPTAGNDIFRVFVEDASGGDGVGTFVVLTGPEHPAGAGHEVLFAGDGTEAGSSYLTVRSDTTGIDYVQSTAGSASGNLVETLDSYGVVEAIGATGFRTTYLLPGTGTAPDHLRIVSDIEVVGTDTTDSSAQLNVTIENLGAVPLRLSVRYLLDLANGGDDGPAVRGAGQTLPQYEEQFYGPMPTTMLAAPTTPDVPQVSTTIGSSSTSVGFASWTHAFPFAFDFQPAGRDIARACGLNDSALLIYFRNLAPLAPGESTTQSVGISADHPDIPADDPIGFSGLDAGCVVAPTTTAPAGEPTPAPQPVELPRTGGLKTRR